MKPIIPIADLGDRPPEQGRIRLGEQYTGSKNGKTFTSMRSLDTFRFTSPDEAAIRSIADRYGGTAAAWSNAKANPQNQWEVTTATSEIRIFLPRDSISTWYELWSGGGCVRRCDGVTVQVPGRDEMTEAPCICDRKQALECKPYTRLAVILPDIKPFGGVWRLETKGWNAAHEMPKMATLIETLQVSGMAEARLILSKESDMQGGKRRHWVEPKLVVDETADAIMAGQSTAGALAAGEQPKGELTAGEPEQDQVGPEVAEEDWFAKDDEIIDAELVEEPEPGAVTPLPPTDDGRGEPEPTAPTDRADTGAVAPAVLKKINAMVTEVAVNLVKGRPTVDQKNEIRHAIVWYASAKATDSTKELSSGAVDKALDTLERCKTQTAWLGKLLEKYRARPF